MKTSKPEIKSSSTKTTTSTVGSSVGNTIGGKAGTSGLSASAKSSIGTKASNVGVSKTGSVGSTKSSVGATTSSKGNSISFGSVNFDAQKNLLKVKTTQGSSQILCCITGDALRECFHAGTSAQDLEKSFRDHETEIS